MKKTNQLDTFSVAGLFGRFDYEIEFDIEGRITIITAPNGYGKSTVLNLIKATLSGHYRQIAKFPFTRLRISMTDGKSLDIQRKSSAGGEWKLVIVHRGKTRTILAKHEIRGRDIEEEVWRHGSSNITARATRLADRTPYLSRVAARRWRDIRSGDILSDRDVVRFYGGSFASRKLMDNEEPSKIVKWRSGLPVTLVSSDRLHIDASQLVDEKPISAVETLNHTIRDSVAFSLQDYATESHRVDSRFLTEVMPNLRTRKKKPTKLELTALKKTEARVRELELEYESLGLLQGLERLELEQLPVSPAEFVILEKHYEDTENKLNVLRDLAKKLQCFKDALNEAFAFKSVEINGSHGIVVNSDNESISLDTLSSGEQHLMVLFGKLLFRDHSLLVLLDEPEISLHLAWQEQYLYYMKQIGAIEPFQLIMATHSPMIVGGQWGITRELADQAPEDSK